LPVEGDKFIDFRLKTELGRGAFGRVFLAEQETLSNRRVVLKISPHHTIEHRTMARLEHPNIVPILSVHRDEQSDLQAVCMPYQYAVALSDVRAKWTDATLQANRAET
jgi:eukaryotic-like serine/threonine-protein kinase